MSDVTDLIPYADRDPFPMKISDGVRIRKTDSGYVVERLKPDLTWEELDVSGGAVAWGNITGTLTDQSNVDTDGTLAADSDSKLATQKAVKTYVDDQAGGGGDVVGPASATEGHLAVFADGTGKLLEDGGAVPGGGGISVKVIDLGVISVQDVIEAGIMELVPFVAGRLITNVFATTDQLISDSEAPLSWPELAFNTHNIVEDNENPFFGSAFAKFDNGTPGFYSPIEFKTQFGIPNDCGPLVAGVREIFLLGNSNAPGTWQSAHLYDLGDQVIDSNSNLQKVTTPGTSDGSEPEWSEDQSGTTSDGTSLVWTNLGTATTTAQVHLYAEVCDVPDLEIPRAASIEFVQQPTNVVAEVSMSPSPTILVKDQNGDPFTAFPFYVEIYTRGSAAMEGFEQASDPTTGIVTFDVIINTPGTYILRATPCYSFGIPAINSVSFDVTAP